MRHARSTWVTLLPCPSYKPITADLHPYQPPGVACARELVRVKSTPVHPVQQRYPVVCARARYCHRSPSRTARPATQASHMRTAHGSRSSRKPLLSNMCVGVLYRSPCGALSTRSPSHGHHESVGMPRRGFPIASLMFLPPRLRSNIVGAQLTIDGALQSP